MTEIVDLTPDELTPSQVRARLGRVALNRRRLEEIAGERERPAADASALTEEMWRLHAETAAILSELGENLGDPTTTVELGPMLRTAAIRGADAARGRARSMPSQAATTHVTVNDLARGIVQSDYTTRRLLERGRIPGARRKTPDVKNSPWLIPEGAARAYLALHDARKEQD